MVILDLSLVLALDPPSSRVTARRPVLPGLRAGCGRPKTRDATLRVPWFTTTGVDPILGSARAATAAARGVTSGVSWRALDDVMASGFREVQRDPAPDAKGMLVVANYGTGKTHLMSVVSSILERAELVESVRSDAVREAAAPVAGRYRVIRAEIGATTMGLRDIITTELTDGLRRLGVDFEFPDLSRVTNTS